MKMDCLNGKRNDTKIGKPTTNILAEARNPYEYKPDPIVVSTIQINV
jgi:hypothetical protein